MVRHLVAFMTLLTACDGGPPPADPPAAAAAPVEEARTTLALSASAESDASVTVHVAYNRLAGQEGPRVVELHLRHSANLAYDSAEPMSAASAAGKRLVVQDRGDGTLRVLLFGTQTLDRLDSGPLLKLALRRLDDAAATLEVLGDKPVFAPAETNTGLTLPPPLTVGGR